MSRIGDTPSNVMVVGSVTAAEQYWAGHAASGGRILPGVTFWQGGRLFFSTAVSFGVAVQHLETRAINRKRLQKELEVDPFVEVREAFNRAVDVDHEKGIVKYLQDNPDKFILPPLIINADENVELVVVGDVKKRQPHLAWLLVDDSFRPVITDGQHKFLAMKDAIEGNSRLRNSGIGIMVSFEQSKEQMHQDFADCAKTKPIPTSLMQVYDRRAKSSQVVAHLSDQCALFGRGKIDPDGASITKRSVKLFLHNQVVGFVKAIVGSRRMTTDDFEVVLAEKLEANPNLPDRIVGYVHDLCAAVEPLRRAAAIEKDQRDQIPELRAEGWIPLTASGLAMLGIVGRELLKLPAPEYTGSITRLAQIDWRVEGDLWRSNLCIVRSSDGAVLRIQSGAKFIEEAADAVLGKILSAQVRAA